MATATKAPTKTSKSVAVKKTPVQKATAKKAPVAETPKKVVAVAVKSAAPDKVAPRVDKAIKIKAKLVRDSFTMPDGDFALIAQLKDKALGFKRPTKKSELLRAGLQVLNGLSDAKLKAALQALAPLQAGRPKKVAG